MVKILSLGNEFMEQDSLAVKLSQKLKEELSDLTFVNIKDSFQLMEYLNENEKIIIIDVVENLKEVKLIGIEDLKLDNILSAHDMDAGFLLKLLGGEKDIRIIGIPQKGKLNKIKEDVKKLL